LEKGSIYSYRKLKYKKKMTWCNDSNHEEDELITPSEDNNNNTDVSDHHMELNEEIQIIKCPSCSHNIEVKNQVLIK
jgi:DNA-directed RNA polymerase subunit RPC12/RpoP